MASNLDFSQEIEENRINELIEATLVMSTRIQTSQPPMTIPNNDSRVNSEKRDDFDHPGMLDIFSECEDIFVHATQTSTSTTDNEIKNEKNDLFPPPSPLAFSYTQGSFFMRKDHISFSNEPFDHRETDLFTELFLESESSKSLPNSGETSSRKFGPACQSEFGQSVNVSSSLKSSLFNADNNAIMKTRNMNTQNSSTQLVHRSFSEPSAPNQKVSDRLPLTSNCSKSQHKNFKPRDINASDAENLSTKTVKNTSVQLLTSLSKSQNLTHQTSIETPSAEANQSSVDGNESLTNVSLILSSSETGINKKSKPAVPPKPRLKLKEHAVDESKRYSYCENGRVNPPTFQKCIDEMFNRQANVKYDSSQMHNDVKNILNEKKETDLEVSKDITAEHVRKEKSSFQSKSNIIESKDHQDFLNCDTVTNKVIMNESNTAPNVPTKVSSIRHPLMSEYERTNSCTVLPSSRYRFSSVSNNAAMEDIPPRKVVSFPESQENSLDTSAWAPPRPSLPQKLRTTHRSLSCSSLVQTFKELGFSKKSQPFSHGKNKNKQNKRTSTDSNECSHSPVRNFDAHSITNKEPAWFHDVDWAEANRRLLAMGQDGAFLIRPSTKKPERGPASLTACVTVARRVLNLRVRLINDGIYALGSYKPGEQTFLSLTDLIKYHQVVPLKVTLGGKLEEKRNVRFLITPPKEVF